MVRTCCIGLLGLLLAGCAQNELGPAKQRPNQPPETVLASGPPDSSAVGHYVVHLYWSGTDHDGTIDHYDFILVDHPASHSRIDAGSPQESRVIVTVPPPDDPRWLGTSVADSAFVTLADTLRRDPRPAPGERPDDVRDAAFERWHTFFVRAVDNEGLADPTPDYRSFNSRNIAPIVRLENPIRPGQEFNGPPVIVFNWSGDDPVGVNESISPVASRFVLIETQINLADPENKYVSYPESLYTLPARHHWSPWRSWGGPQSEGRRAVVSGLARVGDFPGAGFYIFAVQALDEAGAASPVFDWSTPGKNNVALVRVSGNVGPLLKVEEELLGSHNFITGSVPIHLDIAAGQVLNFRWQADAAHYGGEITSYRYGWDIRELGDDHQWSSWSKNLIAAPPQSFGHSSHRFYVQARDIADTITQGIFDLSVHQVAMRRDVLWVDDSDFLTDTSEESAEDSRWEQVLGALAAANDFSFDPSLDGYDVLGNRNLPPPIYKIFDYKSIVWSCRSARPTGSGLRRLAQFVDPLPERNRFKVRPFDYLSIYLAQGGSLWISGFRPARQLWPDERLRGHGGDPVNVTNWDDPLEPHPPGIDSVGTTSLLYAMGVEMFDVAASIDVKRNSKEHYCLGFELCAAARSQSQVTRSSAAEDHTHRVTVLSADLENPGSSGQTYETSRSGGDHIPEHAHTVLLASEDLVALRRGHNVLVESSEVVAAGPHRHQFEIVDQVGAWGSPFLENSPQWSQGGTGARTNIEIYNMPNAMLTERQPLIPLPGISIDLYCYVSGVPERPGTQYPETADKQPAFILAKSSPSDVHYTRAFCGFEPYLLAPASHRQLAEFVLVRTFRLGGQAR